jgi:hypothetical protein
MSDLGDTQRRGRQQFTRPREAAVHQPAARWLAGGFPKKRRKACHREAYRRGDLAKIKLIGEVGLEVFDRTV